MRVLYVYCHPLDNSFHAAIRKEALAGLAEAGHEVDLLDLYAEGFDPVLTAERRRDYHDPERNRRNNEAYADRLMAANALVVQFPTRSFGPPAMLKGWFNGLFKPCIALDLSDPAHARPMLLHIERITGIVTYGRPLLAGDRHVRSAAQDHQALSAVVHRSGTRVCYYAPLSHECRHGRKARAFSRQNPPGDEPLLAFRYS